MWFMFTFANVQICILRTSIFPFQNLMFCAILRVKNKSLMESFYYVPLFTLLSCLISQGQCIKCYICSFSPDDRNNRTDKCTQSNFQHHNVYSDECKLGCETVVQYDPNDEMEQWRRNCLQEGHRMTNDCETEKTVGYRLVRCSCDRDLCNISVRTTSSYISLLFSALTFLWSYHSKLK